MVLDQAHDFAAKAVQLEPILPQARAMLGYVLSRKGEHDAALTEFSRAIERNPNYTFTISCCSCACRRDRASNSIVPVEHASRSILSSRACWVGRPRSLYGQEIRRRRLLLA